MFPTIPFGVINMNSKVEHGKWNMENGKWKMGNGNASSK
jgi:hypothetical protein